ncbi:protein HflC [Clostridia bacterium]|nr:protein HflC [Clostridia bacterium]
MKKWIIAGVAVLAIIILAGNSFFILREDESAIVQRFGRITSMHVQKSEVESEQALAAQMEASGYGYVKTHVGAGLKVKIPFIDSLTKYTHKYMTYDTTPRQVITKDKKKLTFDNNAQWRIENPVMFYIAVRNIATARDRIDNILYSRMNDKVGKMESHVLITDKAAVEGMLRELADEVSGESFKAFGVEVVDIRIKRTDLPPENYDSIYNRMITERNRVAAEYRSEGDEEAMKTRSQTDRDVITITSEAKRQAEVLKGEGDGQAAQIFNEVYGRDPAFFEFYNTLDAYRATINGSATLVIPADAPFAKYLMGADIATAPPAPPVVTP